MQDFLKIQSDKSSKVFYNHNALPFMFRTFDSDFLHYRNREYHNGGPLPYHWHPDLEFCYVIKGSLAFIVNGEKVIVQEGNGIMISCRRLHAIMTDGDNYCKYHILIFHPSLFSHATDEVNAYVSTRFSMSNPDYILLDPDVEWQDKILKTVVGFDAMMNVDHANPLRILSKVIEICAELCDRIEPIEANVRDNNMQISFLQMTDFIKANYSEKITVDDIAAAGHVSRTKCNQLFRKYVHKSPNDYLTQVRLSKSVTMMKDTNLPMIEIAESCGFQSSNYWFSVFKQAYGTTPKNYRDKFLKREPQTTTPTE